MGFIVVGDTENYGTCLVSVFRGNWTREEAEKRLQQMLTAPTENDKRLMEGHTNLRIETTEPKDEWWNDPFLAN